MNSACEMGLRMSASHGCHERELSDSSLGAVCYAGHGPGLVVPRTGFLGLRSCFTSSSFVIFCHLLPSFDDKTKVEGMQDWETKTGGKLESECSECFVVIWVTSKCNHCNKFSWFWFKLDGLNNRNLFHRVLETGRSKVRVPAQLGSGEDPLPGLQMAAFSPCPQVDKLPLL